MSENLYTQLRHAKFRGPTTSDDYNASKEELYKDLVYLYNSIGLVDEDGQRVYMRLIKELFSLSKAREDLNTRMLALEADRNNMVFYSASQVDNDRFEGTEFEVSPAGQCYHDSNHGLLVLPKIESSSVSKLKFVDADGAIIVPSNFETLADGDASTAEGQSGAVVDTSDPYYAVVNQTGKIWQRNVIVNTPSANGSKVNLYVRLPNDLSVVADSNSIILHPFPILGCDLEEVAYSTETDIVLNDTDNYYPLNRTGIHSGDDSAVGWLPPGGWDGDHIENCGPKTFYFDPKPITALRFTLKQSHYLVEGDKIIYSYGLSKLDVRYDKFLDTGKTIIRFDAPDGETISEITDVEADLWNVSEAEKDDVFDYRVIWETSYNSDVYTTVAPASPAQRVWIEVTLNKTLNKATPALSGLIVSYS